MKPIILQKSGSRWHVLVDVDEAKRRSSRYRKKAPDNHVGTLAVIRKGDGKLGLEPMEPSTKPAALTKGEAEGFAHQIGRFMLDLGDFTYTYVEERKERTESSRDDAPGRWSRIGKDQWILDRRPFVVSLRPYGQGYEGTVLVHGLRSSRFVAKTLRLARERGESELARYQAKSRRDLAAGDMAKASLVRQIYAASPKDYRYRTRQGHHVMLPERSGHEGVTLLERLPSKELRQIADRYYASRDSSRSRRRKRDQSRIDAYLDAFYDARLDRPNSASYKRKMTKANRIWARMTESERNSAIRQMRSAREER